MEQPLAESVEMATLFMRNERIENGVDTPLLRVRNYRILTIVSKFGTPQQFQIKRDQMKSSTTKETHRGMIIIYAKIPYDL